MIGSESVFKAAVKEEARVFQTQRRWRHDIQRLASERADGDCDHEEVDAS